MAQFIAYHPESSPEELETLRQEQIREAFAQLMEAVTTFGKFKKAGCKNKRTYSDILGWYGTGEQAGAKGTDEDSMTADKD